MLQNLSSDSIKLEQFTIQTTSPDNKRRIKKENKNLKVIITILCILLIIMIIVLIIILLRKCKIDEKQEDEKSIKPIKRIQNPYWNNNNLPDFAKPELYSITLQLLQEVFNLKEHEALKYFYGNVLIKFIMKSDSKFIVLNSKQQKIESVEIKHLLSNIKEQYVEVVKVINDNFYEQLILVFNETLVKSESYSVNITYSGSILLSEEGIIRTFYRSNTLNKTNCILHSNLEPTGARTMFPCFDEPDKKALFNVKIIHYVKYTALSNMPLLKIERINKSDLIYPGETISNSLPISLSTFNSTFIFMSTYLVAFVLIEDYEKIEQERKPNHNVAIWGPKGLQSTRNKTLKYCITIENFFESYLDFNSLMPQTHHIYIPDFQAGAMENWGLITYRENRLLMNSRLEKSISIKGYMTIAHELAHTWFGNWVTMKTWKDLWLNEGFATYFASFAYYKQLNLTEDKARESFVLQYRQILEKDGKSNSFPVRLKVIKLAQIFNLFTYRKGQALLVWLNAIMSEQKFRAGIQSYIKKYSQKNPTTKDFFKEMQIQMFHSKGFNMSLYEFFYPWLNKIGYPVLTVNYDVLNKRVILSQQSILLNSSKNDVWPIYTSFKTNLLNTDNPILFKGKYHTINITLGENDFIILNNGASSYIRVNYNNYLWNRIINNIRENNGNINSINKIILFDDNFFLSSIGLINASITKDLMDTLVNETNSVLWSLFYNKIFTKMYGIFRNNIIFLKLSKYVKTLSENALKIAFDINADGDLDVVTETFQKQIFLMNCAIDNQKMLDYFSILFLTWIKNPKITVLPKHLVTGILHYGLRDNDKEEYWKIMWKMMMENNDSSSINKDQIAIGLAGTSRPYRLYKLLNYILIPGTHNSDNDKQDFVTELVSWILRSDTGVNILSRWVLNKNKKIKMFAFGDNIAKIIRKVRFNKLLTMIASRITDINLIHPLSALHSNKNLLVSIVMHNIKMMDDFFKLLLQNV